MIKFLKNNLMTICCGALLVICGFLYFGSCGLVEEAAAEAAKNKVLSEAKARADERTAYYKGKYEQEAAKRDELQMQFDLYIVDSKRKIGKLQADQIAANNLKECPDKVKALNDTLDDCRSQVAGKDDYYATYIANRDESWRKSLALCVKEKLEIYTELYGLKDGNGNVVQPGCTQRLAETIAENVKIRASRARRGVNSLVVGIVGGFIIKSCLK